MTRWARDDMGRERAVPEPAEKGKGASPSTLDTGWYGGADDRNWSAAFGDPHWADRPRKEQQARDEAAQDARDESKETT